ARAVNESMLEGDAIASEIGSGAKEPLVTNILHIDHSTAVSSSGGAGVADRREPRPATTIEGTVKWFEPDGGYGFISPDGGGKDVFIHITALRRSVSVLGPGQRVMVEVVDGKRGSEADRITLI